MPGKPIFNRSPKVIMGVVLVLLAGLAILASMVGSGRYQPSRTEVLVMMLEGGCKQYKTEWGSYPPVDPDAGTSSLYRCLGLPRGNRPPIIDFPPNHVKAGAVVDEWGRPLRYLCPGRRNKNGVDLWSSGANGKDELDPKRPDFDDLTNWVRIDE